MSVTELLNCLSQRGEGVRVNQGQLELSPASRLTSELRAELRAHKPELIELLATAAAPGSPVIADPRGWEVEEEVPHLVPASHEPSLLAAFSDDEPEEAEEIDWFAQIGLSQRAYLLGEQYKPEPCHCCGRRGIHHAECLALDPKGPCVLKFGKHRGKTIWQVPAEYLIWCLEQPDLRLTKELQEEMLRCLHQQPTIQTVKVNGKVVRL